MAKGCDKFDPKINPIHKAGLWYTVLLLTDSSLPKLIDTFLQRGGRIDKYYLRDTNRGKRTLVHLHGWFSGQNIRAAILKAFGKV